MAGTGDPPLPATHEYTPCTYTPADPLTCRPLRPLSSSAGMLIHESLTGNPVFPIGEQL